MDNKNSFFSTFKKFKKQCWDIDQQSNQYKADISNWEEIHISRNISVWITYCLRNTPITPNQVTALWVVMSCVGALLLVFNQYSLSLLGVFLLFLARVLDSTDGELARVKKIFSSKGDFLDMLGHDLAYPLMFAALTFAYVLEQQNIMLIAAGLLATVFVTPVTKMQEKVKLLMLISLFGQSSKATSTAEVDALPENDINTGKQGKTRVVEIIAFLFTPTPILYLLMFAVVFKIEALYLIFYGVFLPLVYIPKFLIRAKELEQMQNNPEQLGEILRPEWLDHH